MDFRIRIPKEFTKNLNTKGDLLLFASKFGFIKATLFVFFNLLSNTSNICAKVYKTIRYIWCYINFVK